MRVPDVPTAHPLFDEVADLIGGLSPEIARRISEVYDVVTGMRTLAAGFPAPAFLEVLNELQGMRLNRMAQLLKEEFLQW